MPTGYIARLNQDRGFGFIRAHEADDTGHTQEWFFHRSECETPYEDLRLKQHVEFEEQDTERGKRALGVVRA